MSASRWDILTGEYPPQNGGVGDYTRVIARGLAQAGDEVTIWAPKARGGEPDDPGVRVRRLPDHFGPRSLLELARDLPKASGPGRRRLLVQYVPQAFGWKGLNVPFCLWLRARRRDPIWVMFHEVAYPIARGQSLQQNALGVVTRWMAGLVGASAERVFITVPAWRPMVPSTSASITWLPVPSTIPVVHDAAATAAVRQRYAGGRPLVGHLGTYGQLIDPMISMTAASLLDAAPCSILLLGRDSDMAAARIAQRHPRLAPFVHGTGGLSAEDVSRHLAACDLMLQPYPDGVSTRRTTAMAALAHGRPLVTTQGALTESLWASSGAVSLAPAGDCASLVAAAAALVADPIRAARIGSMGAALYTSQFELRHTIAALRYETAEPLVLRAVS